MKHIKKEYNYLISYLSLIEDDVLTDYYSNQLDYLKNINAVKFGTYGTEVLFVPKIKNIDNVWPPSHNEEELLNERDFNLSLIYNNEYSVTPNNELAGQVKEINYETLAEVLRLRENLDGFIGVERVSKVLFVTDTEFELYTKEILDLKKVTKQNEIENTKMFLTEDLEKTYQFPFFIKEKVLKCLSKNELLNLQRFKDDNGNIVKL